MYQNVPVVMFYFSKSVTSAFGVAFNTADELLWDVILTELFRRGHLHVCMCQLHQSGSWDCVQEAAQMPDTASSSRAGRDTKACTAVGQHNTLGKTRSLQQCR